MTDFENDRDQWTAELKVALHRTILTAKSLGQAEQREIDRLRNLRPMDPKGVRPLPEAVEFSRWMERLTVLLAPVIRSPNSILSEDLDRILALALDTPHQ